MISRSSLTGTFAAVIAVVAIVWIAQWRDDHRNAQNATLRADIARRDATIRVLQQRVAQVDTLYVEQKARYGSVRSSVLDDVSRDRIPRSEVELLVGACDSTIAASEIRVAARDTLIDTLTTQITVYRRLVDRPEPRLRVVAEGLVDVMTKAASVRTALELRIAGPIVIRAEAELAPTATVAAERAVARVGVRYAFR